MVISLIIFASQALQEIRTCMHGTNKPANGKKKKKQRHSTLLTLFLPVLFLISSKEEPLLLCFYVVLARWTRVML
jgi:hypothetical protein